MSGFSLFQNIPNLREGSYRPFENAIEVGDGNTIIGHGYVL